MIGTSKKIYIVETTQVMYPFRLTVKALIKYTTGDTREYEAFITRIINESINQILLALNGGIDTGFISRLRHYPDISFFRDVAVFNDPNIFNAFSDAFRSFGFDLATQIVKKIDPQNPVSYFLESSSSAYIVVATYDE